MRRTLFLACMAGVAFVTLPSDAVVSAANAQESTGLEWADARIKWQGDIGQLIIRIRDYRLRRQYCRRPHRDSKDFDEIGLQQLEEELALLIREFGRIQAGTTTATRGQSGASYTEGTYPEYRGHEVTDDMHWKLLRRDYITDAQSRLKQKKDELARAPEVYCGPPSPPKKEIGVVNPPVQPPPPPPPSVDPLAGLERPTFEAANIPPLVDFYCTQAEKDAALAQIAAEIAKLQGQIAQIDSYLSALGARRSELASKGVEAHWLSSMDHEARQAQSLKDDRRTVIETLNTTRGLIESTPVVDCTKKVGYLPNLPKSFTAGIETGYGELTIPKKPYLSVESGGNQYLGVVDHERVASVATMLLSLTHEFDCDRLPNLSLGIPRHMRWMSSAELFGYDYSVYSSNGSINTTTEGVGIPGTGDPWATYPAGVFLPNPDFNDVTDINYSHKSELDGLSLGFGQKSYYTGWTSTLGLGMTYTRLETSDNLTGTVSAYPIYFGYNTDIETRNFGLFVKGGAEIAIDDYWDTALRYAGEFSGFRLAVEAKAGVNVIDAQGADSLYLSGSITDTLHVSLSKDDTTFNYQLGAALKYVPPGVRALELSLGAKYGESDTHPVANRSGQTDEQTQIEFETEKMFLGTFGANIKF